MYYHDLVYFYNWFADYTASYRMETSEDQENIELKIAHTYRVRDAIQEIGLAEALPAASRMLTETMALFHDVGRFEQYRRYRTFKDAASANHAELGAEVLRQNRVLERLSGDEAQLIIGAVELHNRAALHGELDRRLLYFTRMLRDADKVDIFKVVTDYYARKEEATNKTIELELSDAPEFSGKVLGDFLEGRVIRAADMRTLSDFKLLQLAWVHDLNFNKSLEMIRENRYLEKILATLPEIPEAERVRDYIAFFMGVPVE